MLHAVKAYPPAIEARTYLRRSEDVFMVSFPHAKINLGLNIIRKRPDGYHDLQTCFYPIPWADLLEIIPAREFQFSSSGLSIDTKSDDNLCVKAYNLLKNDFDLPPVQMHLHKIIPMGAGLGGGSSDAAFTLLQLNESFQLKLSVESLEKYAAALGSDCAYFISNRPMLGSGRGEILFPAEVSLKGKFVVVVKPDIHVSTADAFSGIVPRTNEVSIADIIRKPITDWRQLLFNDFESSIFKKYPAIEEIKEALYNAGSLYASMSGSGSSVFGIFDKGIELSERFGSASYWSGSLD
jgi:4-diphosphocytidyl-2-C-methyl-D-erythritol kinase